MSEAAEKWWKECQSGLTGEPPLNLPHIYGTCFDAGFERGAAAERALMEADLDSATDFAIGICEALGYETVEITKACKSGVVQIDTTRILREVVGQIEEAKAELARRDETEKKLREALAWALVRIDLDTGMLGELISSEQVKLSEARALLAKSTDAKQDGGTNGR